MILRDWWLEVRIWRQWRRFRTAHRPADMYLAWQRMRVLIGQRSPAQIERMERKRGLI